MTRVRSSIRSLVSDSRAFLLALALLGASLATARAGAQNPAPQPDDYQAAMNALVADQQEALSSGDPDRILKSSGPVAAASLALLDSLDEHDQETRNAVAALPYAQDLLADLPVEMMLLRMELSLGETAQATELKNHILSTNTEDAQLHLALAQSFEQSTALDIAVLEAQRAVELNPSSLEAQIALGVTCWGLNAYQYNEDTLRAFTAAQQLDPEGFTSNLLLGSIESQYQRFDEADQHLRAAIAADPSAPGPWYQLGMNAYDQSKEAESADQLEHYLSLAEAQKNGKPKQMRLALLTLDEIAIEQGKPADAARRAEEDALQQQMLQAANAEDPNTGATALPMGSPDTLGRSALPDKRNNTANTMTVTMAQLRELAAGALGNIGTVLARKKEYAAAVTPLKFAAAEDPDLQAVTRNLALTACISGSYEDGAQAIQQLAAAHPDDATARGCLAMADYAIHDDAGAASVFDSLGPALASNALYEATAAAAFAATGNRDHAQQVLARLKNESATPQLQAREAVAYLALGNATEAAALATAALSDAAHHPPEALRVLGLLALERGDAHQAVAQFEEETKSDQEDAAERLESQALLAKALIDSGDKSKAEDLSLTIAKANPNLAGALLHQSETSLKAGNAQGSYEKLAAAVALAPRDLKIRAAFLSARRALRASSR